MKIYKYKSSIILIIISLILSFTSCDNDNNEIETKDMIIDNYKNIISEQNIIINKLKNELLNIKTETQNIKEENIDLKNQLDSLMQTESENNKLPDEENKQLYHVNSDGNIIISYSGSDINLHMPQNINGVSITEIADNAFQGQKLETVVIPDGYEKIGWFAFNSCLSLKSIFIPESINEIGYSAFDYCSENFKIMCKKNSYAHKYAVSFGIKYELI